MRRNEVLFRFLLSSLILIFFIKPIPALDVVCTNPDFLPIVKEVGGDVNVISILPPGSDPHSFSLSKSDVDKLKSADLIVLTNSELFSFEKKIKNEYPAKVLDFEDYAAEGAKLDDFPGFNHNPHGYWLKIENAVSIAKAIEKRLSDLSPDKKENFSYSFVLFKTKMMELKKVSAKIIKKHNASCVAVIPGVTYIIENFGLEVGAVLLGEGLGFASGKEYAEIQRKLKTSEYACIVVPESMKKSKAGEIAEQLSKDSGKPVVYVKFVVGSEETDFAEIQMYNLIAFAKSFDRLQSGNKGYHFNYFNHFNQWLLLMLVLMVGIEAVVIFVLWKGVK